MTNQMKMRFLSGASLLCAPLLAVALTGCSSEPEPPPVQTNNRPVAPPPVEVPRATGVEDLMAQMSIDPRINMSESDAPATEAERRAVLEFCDAFLKPGAESRLGDMLAAEDRMILDELAAAGRLPNPDDIDDVTVFTGPNPMKSGIGSSTANLAMLAVFTVNGRMEPTMWYYEDGEFVAGITPLDVLDRMSGADPISAWHDVVEDELSRGSQLEIDVQLPQKILEQRQGGGGGAPTQPGPGQPTPPSIPSPGGPGGPSGPGPSVPL